MTKRPDGFIPYDMRHWDIPLTVARGQAFRWRPVDGGWLGVDGGRILWVRAVEGGAEYSTLPEPGREDWVREYFRLAVDLPSVQRRVCRAERSLRPLIDRFPGLRVLRWKDAEECLLSFLCSVNNNIPRICGMVERLCARFGRPIAPGLHAFPKAWRIIEASEQELRELGYGYRAGSIRAAANALKKKPEGWLPSLASLTYEEARAELRTLPGVGRKVADCVCLFALGFEQATPVDTHLWHAACERYFPEWHGLALTERRYEAVSRFLITRFGNLAGWAHQYLFYERLLRRDTEKGLASTPTHSL